MIMSSRLLQLQSPILFFCCERNGQESVGSEEQAGRQKRLGMMLGRSGPD